MKPKDKKKNIFVDRKTLLLGKKSSLKKTEKTSKKNLSKRELDLRKKIMQKVYLFVGVLALTLFFIGSIFIWVKSNQYKDLLNSKISYLDNSCKIYQSDIINTFLTIELDKSQNIREIYLNIFDKEKKISFAITNYKFIIDNAGTEGTLIDYIRLNNLFLDKTTLFKNLSSTLVRQLFVKIDFVIILDNQKSPKDIKELDGFFYQYLFDQLAAEKLEYQLITDLCKDSIKKIFEDFYSTNTNGSEIRDFNATALSNFDFSDIRKEQLRIYINNRSGVENLGEFYRTLFQGYGLNVVKLDNSLGESPKTSIAIDDSSINGTNTLMMTKYLLNNQIGNIDVNTQTNIFSNIYIELGEDSLINQ